MDSGNRTQPALGGVRAARKMFQVNIGDAYLQCSFHVLIFPVPRDRAPWPMDLDGDDEDESPKNEAAEDRFSEKCTLFWLPILFFFGLYQVLQRKHHHIP